MALPASKRRKTDHVSSSDEGDDASFASFSDDAGEGAEEAVNGADSAEDEEMDDVEESEGGSDDEASDDEEEMDERGTTIATSKTPPTKSDTRRKPDRALQAGANAYANGSYKSNVFKLQVDELLTQVRPRQGQREGNAEAALHKLKKTVEQIPQRGPFLLQDAERNLIKEKVAIPFPEPRPPKDAKYKLAYAKPSIINVVGSFALKTSLRSRDHIDVDMIVVMPSSILEDKDYLNYRYFYKRAYYLACIAAGLKKTYKNEYQVRYKLMHNDPLKPILAVSPLATSGEMLPADKWSVNIIPCVGEAQFSVEKLRPEKNCVRASSGDELDKQPSTPAYNSSLRADMLMMEYLKLLHGASRRCDAFKDACLLGSTWLRQRDFASTNKKGGFGNFEWNAFMALCLQGGGANDKPLLSDGYSSYQLFKATLQLIAMKDFVKSPLRVGSASDAPRIPGPVVWDAERRHNLLYRASEWAYKRIRSEARSTLTTLGDQMHDGFDATFIMRLNEALYSSDYVVQIPERLLLRGTNSSDHDSRQHLQTFYDVLRKGLGDRVASIAIKTDAVIPWDLGSSRPRAAVSSLVTVGLVVNPDTVRRTVDHGPSAEQKTESAAFRKFWGEKAELRRFKDGSILESLVWSSPQESGHSVLEQVVRFLLGHHFGAVTLDDVKLFGDDFGKLVRGGSDIKSFEPLMTRYKHFENDVRDLHDLPLSIRQIMPASAQLCYSSTRPPANGHEKPVPADVTIQFEGSGRWPDDLVAIQRTKIAFLLKINDMLSESVDGITTRIGLENEGQDTLNKAFLDVTYEQDATFRLRIHHDREQTLLERQLKSKTTDPKTREIAAIGLAKYKREYVKAPAQTQAITRLCTRLPALSGAIRLTKKWFASHLLANHIPEEVVELLVVRTFTQPSPWQTPSSVQTGFLRTLFWISRWDWRADPLIVDLSASGDLKQADMQTIRTNFEAWRKLDPAMNRVALFAASNLDHDGTTWTDGTPAKVVAGRMTALAKAACAEVAEKQLELEPASLFSSSLNDFDFVLHVNSAFVTGKNRRSSTAAATYKNLELDTIADTDLIGLDHVKSFLTELESVYGSAILFFYGASERTVITGLWSPLTARRSWRVNLAYSTIPIKGESDEGDVQASLNKNAILAEIARLSGDLVEKVEVVKK
ncbi:U3 small nucleolar RNA-associated protein 22 [Pseudocercospora fuligena]|uniref:U3 small nucleolar RNA-associated protein 22 n=1 Tax=Pseudocercospora fuligena TaxID=685502 RepID=A0A8H6R880_9PEZI|nr:U3 small nucleolar RNA-associated protein 22 [Pseudocercospora fuligena]